MNIICIIAGGGKLPIRLYEKLQYDKNNIVYLWGIKNHFKNLKYFSSEDKKKYFSEIKLGSLGKILKFLEINSIKKIIFAGSIKRPSLKDLSLDFHALKFISGNDLENLGDDSLLKNISKFFENKGFKFIKWYDYFPEMFTEKEFLTQKKPNNDSINNLKIGLNIFKKFGRLDIGQSLIMQNNLVLGLEAAEGTDNLLKRCFKYKKKGEKGIIIKLKKFNQDLRFDLPTIGLNTIKLIKKYDYEGIFIQKKYCLIIDKEKVIKFANNNNIFISSINL